MPSSQLMDGGSLQDPNIREHFPCCLQIWGLSNHRSRCPLAEQIERKVLRRSRSVLGIHDRLHCLLWIESMHHRRRWKTINQQRKTSGGGRYLRRLVKLFYGRVDKWRLICEKDFGRSWRTSDKLQSARKESVALEPGRFNHHHHHTQLRSHGLEVGRETNEA